MKGLPLHATTSLTVNSPVGNLVVFASPAGVAGLFFAHRVGGNAGAAPTDCQDDPLLRQAATQLAEYFAGDRTTFDLPLDARGTAFQSAVWDQLRRIPFGTTVSYGEIARRIGNQKAVRAVGLANGSNPVSIIVPCHRVIGSDGSLTGFGGGLPIKRELLRHEGALLLS